MSSPEIGLYLDQIFNILIDVTNNFGPEDICYYHFYAEDLNDQSDEFDFKTL